MQTCIHSLIIQAELCSIKMFIFYVPHISTSTQVQVYCAARVGSWSSRALLVFTLLAQELWTLTGQGYLLSMPTYATKQRRQNQNTF